MEGIIDVGQLKKFESVGFDTKKFEAVRTKIDKIEVIELPSMFDAEGKTLPPGQTVMVPVLKVSTEVLDKIIKSDGTTQELRASEIFNLRVKEVNGKREIGWSTGPRAKLFAFLKKMKVNSPNELIGQYVTVISRLGKNENEYLGFAH